MMDNRMKQSRLFAGMNDGELTACLQCCGAGVVRYRADEIVFRQGERPTKLFVLLSGAVSVCQDSPSGKRTLMNRFDRTGDLFGEVYAFLDRDEYDYYALAETDLEVLELPRAFLYQPCANGCAHHNRMTQNMLTILAEKAFTLNRKLQLLSLPTLRHKIAALLLRNLNASGLVALKMNREEMADYLGVARPSLSRELLHMQEEGLLQLDGRQIAVTDVETLQNLF